MMYGMPPNNQPVNNGWVDLGAQPNVPGSFGPGPNVMIIIDIQNYSIDDAANGQSEFNVVKYLADIES